VSLIDRYYAFSAYKNGSKRSDLLGFVGPTLADKNIMRWILCSFLLLSTASAAEKLVSGLDSKGIPRACHPMRPDDDICTSEFTEGDQYAVDCVAKGGEAIACGCHDYLCIWITP
jgi:hypothetical protein